MKHYTSFPFTRISYGLMFFLIGGLGLLSSCKEEDPTQPRKASGPPSIQAVRSTDPAKSDSTFTQSTLGSIIVIVGNNLEATQYVAFNGYQTPVNPVYATNTHLIVRVPDQVPTVATAGSVPNELTVVSPGGEATYAFTVLPPPPVVEAISNEFAKAGETITLYGNYFYFVEEVRFPGGVTSTEFTASPNGKSLTVKVPAGVDPAATTNGELRVQGQSGLSAVNEKIKFNDAIGMIENWDDKTQGGYWGKVTTSSPTIQPIDRNFMSIIMPIPGSYGWNENKARHFTDWGGAQIYPTSPGGANQIYDPNAAIGNFELRMEVAAVTSALDDIVVQMVAYTADGTELQAAVPLTDFVRSTDGKWYTVGIPLGSLAKGDVKLAKYSDLLNGKSGANHAFRIIFNKTTAGASPNVELAYDNVRVVNVTR
ncbi:MAG: hypothetical protein ICV83_06570 [Cytophagales bacterium]|nr:hypothetical protein [Cytophagales bacterium]